MEIINLINSLINAKVLIICNLIVILSALAALKKAVKCKFKLSFKLFPLFIVITCILTICQLLAI